LRRRPTSTTLRTSRTTSPLTGLRIFLRINLLDDLLDLLARQHLDLLPGRHDGDFDILRACLHDFQQGFDGEFDGVGPGHGVFVVALEEFADCFAAAADGVGFPVLMQGWLVML
jgi:hypothetical protein